VILDRNQISYAGPTAGAPAGSNTDDVVEVPVVTPGLWACDAHYIGMTQPNLAMIAATDPITAYDADVIALDTDTLDDRSVWGDATRVTHIWQVGQRARSRLQIQNVAGIGLPAFKIRKISEWWGLGGVVAVAWDQAGWGDADRSDSNRPH
jgi:hypothetical protein